jgi:hypothetical protein
MQPDWPILSHCYFECGLCGTRFGRVHAHRPNEWVWVIAGVMAFMSATILAVALWVGAHSTCADVRFDSELSCVDKGQVHTWFDSGEALAIAVISAIAVALIPAVFIFVASRLVWLLVLPVTFIASIVAGVRMGEMAVERRYPEMFWEDPDLWNFPLATACCGTMFFWLMTLVALDIAWKRPSRWQLERLR